LDPKNNSQETLKLKIDQQYLIEDYIISDSNRSAYNTAISSVIGYDPMPNILIIKAEKSSGKTFLANVVSDFHGAKIIHNIEDSFLSSSGYLILDDAQKYDETKLFHLINFACNNSKKLLLIFSSSFSAKLADLNSRIKSIKTEELNAPDEDMMEMYILSIFSKKSIAAQKELINYLKVRLPRNFHEISEFINKLDDFCLKKKKNMSIKSASLLFSDIS
jgi:chromosomal replication initiation ATPase DnaA